MKLFCIRFLIVLMTVAVSLVNVSERVHAQEPIETEKRQPGDVDASEVSLEAVIEGFDDAAAVDDTSAGESVEDILEGFDDDQGLPVASESKAASSRFSFDGFAKIGTTYNFAHEKPRTDETDWRGFSRLRGELQLELKTRISDAWQALVSGKGAYDAIYRLNGRSEYTDDVVDNYESELELRETYIQGSVAESLDLKLGRQIVVWGKSDNIRVTDVLNPLDMREPGLTDIEDLRLPVTMTRLDYYIDDWSLTGIAVHEIRFNKNPEYGSDFYPGTVPLPHEDEPTESIENTEWAAAVNGIFSGWDMAFYYARFFDDTAHLETDANFQNTERVHSRLDMFGLAVNMALGNWLLKAESAYFDGIAFFNTESDYSRIDILAGFEYSGFTDTTVSIEAVNRHVNGFDEVLAQSPDFADEDEFQSAVRVERNFLNDTLTLTVLALTYGVLGEDGAVQRFSAAYDVTDAVEVTGGVALYRSGGLARLEDIGDNDRLFIEITYSF
jgi:uncharacterized protein DUF1302